MLSAVVASILNSLYERITLSVSTIRIFFVIVYLVKFYLDNLANNMHIVLHGIEIVVFRPHNLEYEKCAVEANDLCFPANQLNEDEGSTSTTASRSWPPSCQRATNRTYTKIMSLEGYPSFCLHLLN